MLSLLQSEVDTPALGTPAVTTSDLIVIAAVVVGAFIVTRFVRPITRALLGWLSRRSLAGRGRRWRVRAPRVFGETIEQAELRRTQRVAATAAGISRIVGGVVWVIALFVILERAEIDPVFAISGAGFLGVAIAIGGQHSVNDFVTGMHILFEDRFGEGDRLRVEVEGEEVELTVVSLGAFATRLEDGKSTFHIPNREMTPVANLSQRGSTTEFDFAPAAEIPASNPRAQVEAAVRARYNRSNDFDASTDGIVVDSVRDEGDAIKVRVRTARPLSDAQRQALAQPRAPEQH